MSERAAGDGSELRLDRWLFYARFFKSRTRAQRFCEAGKVRINRVRTRKAHYALRPGDVLTFALGKRVRIIRVRELGERRGPAPKARALYDDLAPDPAATPA